TLAHLGISDEGKLRNNRNACAARCRSRVDARLRPASRGKGLAGTAQYHRVDPQLLERMAHRSRSYHQSRRLRRGWRVCRNPAHRIVFGPGQDRHTRRDLCWRHGRGCPLGTMLGPLLAARWTDTNIWLALAALCLAAPWIQGLGRLRCLVQGCCHGRPTTPEIGIRYSHPRSRVCRVPGLRDIPIHATPLYSLLWNVFIALLLTRLYFLQVNAAMIGGI